MQVNLIKSTGEVLDCKVEELPEGYILAVAPHMDDLEYSCMSAYKLAADRGHDLVVVQTTYGTRQSKRIKAYPELAKLLNRHFYLVQLEAFQDGEGSIINMCKLVTLLDGLFVKASCAFIPEPSMHQDHEVVHKACMAAARQRNSLSGLKEIYAYGYFYNIEETCYNVYIELTKFYVDVKLKFLSIIDSKDIVLNNKAFSLDSAQNMMKMYGYNIPTEYAEAFRLVRLFL